MDESEWSSAGASAAVQNRTDGGGKTVEKEQWRAAKTGREGRKVVKQKASKDGLRARSSVM